jgi:uncharacterized protein
MKYLLVLVIVVIAIWLWRRGREEESRSQAPPQRKRPGAGSPTEMARCAHCGLHFPAADAVAGRANRLYCSAPHRAAAER